MIKDYDSPIGFDTVSILIYMSFFMMSFLFCYLSERMYKKKKKWVGILWTSISILVLCILATLRSTTVGGDISVYLLPNFEKAITYSKFLDFYVVASSQMEVLFSLLVYLFAKIGSIKCLFFAIEFLVLTPVYYVLYKNRERCSITVGYIIYVFLFYNFSLSGMRQSIAMSMLFLATNFLLNREYLKLIFWSIIAILFHKGTIIALFLITLIIAFENRKSYKKMLSILMIILIVFFVLYNQFVNILANVFWLINPRYSFYIRTNITDNIMWSNIPNTDIVLKLGIVMLCVIFGHYKKSINKQDVSLLVFSLIGRYFVLLNARMYEALRIAYYFDIFTIILAANTVHQQKINMNKKILSICLIGLAFLYWIYFIMYIGGYKTNIFTFG